MRRVCTSFAVALLALSALVGGGAAVSVASAAGSSVSAANPPKCC